MRRPLAMLHWRNEMSGGLLVLVANVFNEGPPPAADVSAECPGESTCLAVCMRLQEEGNEGVKLRASDLSRPYI
eukprot:scaffold3056_cov378-Prasinococcus_capsulatus_cf.AAC.6